MEEVVLDGKTYVASKKAAIECGYTQDYVGQLSRSGQIDAKRVSGQWYIFLDSLRSYKEKAALQKPEPPKYQPDPSVEQSLNLDEKEYVTAALASKLTDYNQDYIGQLARAGKIPSKQVANRWYIEREALLAHKVEKDAMLRAVQAESVGLWRPEPSTEVAHTSYFSTKTNEPKLMVYRSDDKPLFPEPYREEELRAVVSNSTQNFESTAVESRIPIRVLPTRDIVQSKPVFVRENDTRKSVSIPRKSIFNNVFSGMAVVAVLVVVIGVGTLKKDSIYAIVSDTSAQTQVASVATATESIALFLEQVLATELVYKR